MTIKQQARTIDEYIETFPIAVQRLLKAMRRTIRKGAPKAEETISYQIPTFRLNGNLVHFGAFKDHIGFYPTPSGIDAFRKELKPYAVARGTIRFPFAKPLPLTLVEKITTFRVAENFAKSEKKRRS